MIANLKYNKSLPFTVHKRCSYLCLLYKTEANTNLIRS